MLPKNYQMSTFYMEVLIVETFLSKFPDNVTDRQKNVVTRGYWESLKSHKSQEVARIFLSTYDPRIHQFRCCGNNYNGSWGEDKVYPASTAKFSFNRRVTLHLKCQIWLSFIYLQKGTQSLETKVHMTNLITLEWAVQ